MSLEREAEIEIFANGISADIALVDFAFQNVEGGGADSRSGMTLPFSVATITRPGKNSSHLACRP